MSTPCGCSDSNPKPAFTLDISIPEDHQEQTGECPAIVHETVCVQAEVSITPNVEIGEIESFCVNGPKIKACPGPHACGTCTFIVSQNICVQVPLTFSASAAAESKGIICGTPKVGPCPNKCEEFVW